MTDPIIDFIEHRRTANFFDPAVELSRDDVERLVELASRAPSSFNLQNWRLIAVQSPDEQARLRAVGWDQEKITDAAVTFVVVGQPADHEQTRPRLEPAIEAGIMSEAIVSAWEQGARMLYHEQPWRQRDEAVRSATFAVSTLILAAHTMGLGAAPMSGFDVDGVTEAFGLEDGEFPVMLVAIGRATERNWRQKPRRSVAQLLSVR